MRDISNLPLEEQIKPTDMDATNGSSQASHSLKDRLTEALPSTFTCNIRYVHSPPKPCEPLFSALPGQEPEKTRLASHFLTASVTTDTLTRLDGSQDNAEVISFAVEVLVYSSKRLTTIFVSKVDSTPFIPRIRPSPIKTTITTFLQWLADEELRKHPRKKVVISLFARAQAQYLFPGSSDDKTKHVLDDRQLIKWWARVLDPIIPKGNSGSIDEASTKYQGYMTVPGYVGSELRSFMPLTTSSTTGKPSWLPGNPLPELARARGIPEYAPPRCLLPRFPDDPKARYMSDLDDEIGISSESKVTVSPSKKKSGQWKSVRDLDRFWEAMEFRQECSSGRVVGFLWLVISPEGSDEDSAPMNSFSADSQDSTVSLGAIPVLDPPTTPILEQASQESPKKKKSRRKPLAGPIVARQPRLKGGSSGMSSSSELQALVDAQSGEGTIVTKEGYDKAMHTLLQLDFSNLEVATRSTSKWCREVFAIAGLTSDCAVHITGTAKAEQSATSTGMNGAPAVNDLGGMIKKKRKAVDNPAPEAATEPVANGTSAVNMLSAGMVRKKPKPAS